MNRPLLPRFLIIAFAIAIAFNYAWPLSKIKKGIDIAGGVSYTIKLDLSKLEDYRRKGAVDRAIEILRKRLDPKGLLEPILQAAGEDRVLIQLPGLKDEDKKSVAIQLKRKAFLELRIVHPQNAEELAKMQTQKSAPPAGYELLILTDKKQNQAETKEPILVRKRAEITGQHLVRATARMGPGGYEVDFELNPKGGEIFRQVTRENIGKRLAIVLDGEVISAPSINSEIGANGQITGNFDFREANDLANSLQNPLETPVEVLEVRDVSASLGEDSVKSGMTAGLIGLGAVVVFMTLYYLRAGVVANIALAVNIILLFGVLTIFDFTLTLPGVAGIILTVGIAVDANVLIYERIREELAKGKLLIPAIDAGFDRAFGTIIDANVTTLITALVLSWLGTGAIQGFGYTLSAGIITSVFCAVYVTRFIFDFMLKYMPFQKLTMLSFVGQTRFNFLGVKWPAIALSSAIIIAGAFVAINKGESVYGVDFTGGESLRLKVAQRVELSDLTKALHEAGFNEPFLQYQTGAQGGGDELTVKVPKDMGQKAEEILKASFPNAGFSHLGLDIVGGTVGSELRTTAVKGLLWAAFCILIYISMRFEFAYAVGAIVALIHDVLVCLAFFFFLDKQLSLPVIGALLTIAGYSLNDTVVVFDRIREEFKLKGEKMGFREIINLSVNETLGRTLLTSLTTLIAGLALFIFGGGVIHDFAFILVVGVLTGTYSSVFIASPVLLLWHPSKLAPRTEGGKGEISRQRQAA